MTKQWLIERLTAAGWRNLDDSWTMDELQEVYADALLVERQVQDEEDR